MLTKHNSQPKKQPLNIIPIAALALLAILSVAGLIYRETQDRQARFNGSRAYEDVERQVAFGPRIPGSDAHDRTVSYIKQVLLGEGWAVDIQDTQLLEKPIRNVIGKRGEGRPWIVLGAHYDSRIYADQDPDPSKRNQPVPGAEDGASGVAVLLELARVLKDNQASQIWLVFFDAEDNGHIPGWDWILGSSAFVSSLKDKPDAAIVVDMVGDMDLSLYQEGYSDIALTSEVWGIAQELGYSNIFIPKVKRTILDDHVPFLQAGIPATDIIDLDYPYWHTTSDTPDKVSSKSLQFVGDTLLKYLTLQNRK